MFRHMLKLIWKRKSRNVMLTLEILIAFLVVFAIAGFAMRNYQLYRMPLGLQGTDAWSVRFRAGNEEKIDPAVLDNVKRAVKALPEVEHVTFASFAPFSRATWTTDVELPDGSRRADTNLMIVGDEFQNIAQPHLVEGRWFDASDDGKDGTAVVINRRLAKSLFPDGSAIGKSYLSGSATDKDRSKYVVTGVVDEFRPRGEFMAPVNYFVERATLESIGRQRVILLKVKPGTPRDFEAKLVRQLQQVRGDWSYEVATLDEQRDGMIRTEMIPLVILSVIAAFLLLMVAFGLFGVLWQNTTRRIPEIGLRRALGADAGQIYRQIIAEQMLLSTIAMGIALFLLVQLPITGALGETMNWTVFLTATTLSMAVIYLISLLCSLYPGWRASRLSPTEALHYE
jgi:putative ABC transport system permease protein